MTDEVKKVMRAIQADAREKKPEVANDPDLLMECLRHEIENLLKSVLPGLAILDPEAKGIGMTFEGAVVPRFGDLGPWAIDVYRLRPDDERLQSDVPGRVIH